MSIVETMVKCVFEQTKTLFWKWKKLGDCGVETRALLYVSKQQWFIESFSPCLTTHREMQNDQTVSGTTHSSFWATLFYSPFSFLISEIDETMLQVESGVQSEFNIRHCIMRAVALLSFFEVLNSVHELQASQPLGVFISYDWNGWESGRNSITRRVW